jgi:hypothetical protein
MSKSLFKRDRAEHHTTWKTRAQRHTQKKIMSKELSKIDKAKQYLEVEGSKAHLK